MNEARVIDIDELAEAVREFYVRAHRSVDRAMAASGASFARTKLLMFVDREGPVRSADIAQCFGQAPRTVTEAIDGLERDGLVRREPDPGDRRAKRISITPAGSAAIAASEPSRRALLEHIFSGLTEAERESFAAVMAKLNARLREADG